MSVSEKEGPPVVISASRRTDIPAFYMDWLVERFRQGYFDISNPYNGRPRRLLVSPSRVHSIVLWSKNFRPLLQHRHHRQLEAEGYHLFFNFTINSVSRLEPHLPPLSERLRQLERLADSRDPSSITWRFDPICCFRRPGGGMEDNLNDFERIAARAAACGIKRCVTSFVDLYPKIRKRLSPRERLEFIEPSLGKKTAMLLAMHRVLTERGISLSLCCEKEVLAALPADCGITASACIPNRLLQTLFGGRISLRRDTGQRVRNGCGCGVSVDVGSYRHHPCPHDCLFCYANPARDRRWPGKEKEEV